MAPPWSGRARPPSSCTGGAVAPGSACPYLAMSSSDVASPCSSPSCTTNQPSTVFPRLFPLTGSSSFASSKHLPYSIIVLSSNRHVSGDEKVLVRKGDKPPYHTYAFWNPYNLSLLAGAGAVSAATGGWWIGLCAVAAETIWMLFAPDSTVLRRTWFDKLWHQDKREAKQKEQAKKFATLPQEAQARVLMLRDLQGRIQQLAADNPSFTVDLLRNDLGKLA